MRYLRIFVFFIIFFISQETLSQEILRILKGYVLIDIGEISGYQVDDEIPVYRQSSTGETFKVGTIKIVRFAQGRCAAKIIDEQEPIQAHDFIRLPQSLREAEPMQSEPAPVESGSIGIEKGDKEVSFMGFYAKMLGSDVLSMEFGSIMLDFGYFLNQNLQIGAAPQWMIFPGGDGTYTIFSIAFSVKYHFTTSSKWIPYVTGQWYQDEFYFGQEDILEDAYITIGGGLKNFFNEYAALNTSISYGFPLGGEDEGNVLTIMSGISIIF